MGNPLGPIKNARWENFQGLPDFRKLSIDFETKKLGKKCRFGAKNEKIGNILENFSTLGLKFGVPAGDGGLRLGWEVWRGEDMGAYF